MKRCAQRCFSLGLLIALGCSESGAPVVHAGPPLDGGAGAGGEGNLAAFVDDSSDFETSDVHDIDREVVHFDVGTDSMVWADGTRVSGWTTVGNDLAWERSSVAFRVRFGSENGERRAYFTETDTGTICDLNIYATDQMTIYSTSERPPEE